MHVILFEDSHVTQLYPISVSTPAFALYVGSYRLIDLVRRLEGSVEAVVRPHLRELVKADFPDLWNSDEARNGPILLLNARAVPHIGLYNALKQIIKQNRSGVVAKGQQVACVYLTEQSNTLPNRDIGPGQLTGLIHDMRLDPFDANVDLLDYTHDLVRYQMKYLDENLQDRLRIGSYKEIADGVFVASDDISLGEYHTFDTKKGPILLEKGVSIGPYCFFRGPVYIGANTKVIEHSAIKDCVTVMETAKVGGEVETSTICPYSNKQHHGFLGHSYLGSWINLGAGTCNSDLKNTYGEVTPEYSGRKVKSGMQFLGCVIGDYSKTAINTSIFTGKVIGTCSMLYGFVTTNVPSFVNYARSFGQVTETTVEVMISTQSRMFQRRNVVQRPCDIQLIKDIYTLTASERQLANEPLSL